MSRSSRLKNILNQRADLWSDSESDSSSSSSASHHADENLQPTHCCLVCSVLPNLSSVNTCEKHLNLLTSNVKPTQVVYMMQPPINSCRCSTKSKHRCRSSSSSSSSSSSEDRHRRKKRRTTIELSDNSSSSESDLFFSPDVKSQLTQARLSPSLPPSANISASKQYNELLLTTCLPRNSNEIEPEVEPAPEIIEMESSGPSLPLNRIVHVKDENEMEQKTDIINMAKATEQMLIDSIPQPVIYLKRVRLDDLP